MPQRTHRNSSLFWKTFWISVGCLGLIFSVFYFWTLRPVSNVSHNEVSVPIEESYTPQISDNQNILVIGCDERSQPAKFFLLLRFDAEDNCCYVTPLPPEAEATVNVKTMSITEHYDYGGYEYAVSAAENLFLIHIQKYVRIDKSGIAALVDYFGGMEIDLSRGVETENYQFESTKQRIDGDRMAELLLLGDTNLNGELTCAYINQCMTEALVEKRSNFYSALFNQCDTNFTNLDLSNLVTPIKRFFARSEEKAIPVLLDGDYFDDGERFTPNEDSVKEIQELFQ